MSSSLPSFLTHIDLPYPELQAATRDGELIPVDEGFTPLDIPITSHIRAQSLLFLNNHTPLVAELDTAAWIYGALPEPPRVHRLCVNIESRLRLIPTPRRRIREVVFHDGDVTTIGNLFITSLLRTTIDLLREPHTFSLTAAATVSSVMRIGKITHRDVTQHLSTWTRAPYKRRAFERLNTVPSIR